MTDFTSMPLPTKPTAVAPDGSNVRVLLQLRGGSMAHFELPAGCVSRAIVHRSVEEIWYVVAGRGEMWRRQGARQETVSLKPGVCLTIPAGTQFQFRAAAESTLAAIGITMPPWLGEGEAVFVDGPWGATV